MHSNKQARRGSSTARVIKVAPVTAAIRHALTASLAALALAGPGAAMAATVPTAPAHLSTFVRGPATSDQRVAYPVHDLTSVAPASATSSPSPVVPPPQSGDTVLTNSADISRQCSASCYVLGGAVSDANLRITNSGSLSGDTKYGYAPAHISGIFGEALNGGVAITNSGAISIGTGSTVDAATGIVGFVGLGQHGVGIYNTGAITTRGASAAIGMSAQTQGDILLINGGLIDAESSAYGSVATGISAATAGNIDVLNTADIRAYAGGSGSTARGIDAGSTGGDVRIDNSAAINSSGAYASAIRVDALSGDIGVTNTGDIGVTGAYTASGISTAGAGNATVTNGGAISVTATGPSAVPALLAAAASGPVVAGIYGNQAGDLTINNTADLTVNGGYYDAAGISATSGGHTTVNNSGNIDSRSYGATADGIFATGTLVDVNNSGDIVARGYTWAAGIEAQGDVTHLTNTGQVVAVSQGDYGPAFGLYATGGSGLATIDNSGAIYAYAVGRGASATGISATGGTGGVSLQNTGTIYAVGYYATAIDVNSNGAVDIRNDAALGAGSANYSAVATGIHATTNYDASDISIVNGGDISVHAYYIGTGIDAAATGQGSSVGITNDAFVTVYTGSPYLTATGIVGSGDVSSTVTNNGLVAAVGYATSDGVVSNSVSGLAAAVNNGTVYAITYSGADYANALVASSSGGTALVQNSGLAFASSGYAAIGAQARGQYGAIVNNAGTIESHAAYAYGVDARSGAGDVAINNVAGGQINAQGGWAIGALGVAPQGDVTVANAGTINAYATDLTAVGVRGIATTGDVNLDNSGDVLSISLSRYGAIGAALTTTNGMVNVDNSGSTVAESYYNATALRAAAVNGGVDITNTGRVYALSIYANAVAVNAGVSTSGDITVSNGGSMEALAVQGNALGLVAAARNTSTGVNSGDVTVDNAGSIRAKSYYGNAAGIRGAGDVVAIASSGDVMASGYGEAIGIAAYANTAGISNSGDVSASGMFVAGLYAVSGTGAGTATNSGTVTVAGSAASIGVLVSGQGAVNIQNSGTVASLGDAMSTGILAFSEGDAGVTNSGRVRVGGDVATGVRVRSNANLAVTNSGLVAVEGATSAVGVDAFSDGNATLLNSAGALTATSSAGDAFGLRAGSNGVLGIDNAASIAATGYGLAEGIAVQTYGNATVLNRGDIRATSSQLQAAGIAATADGTLLIDNRGTTAAIADNGSAIGVQGVAAAVTVANTGTVSALGATDALGIVGVGDTASLTNGGSISAAGQQYAYGAYLRANVGQGSLVNAGSISSTGDYSVAAMAIGGTSLDVRNDGTLASVGDASSVGLSTATKGSASLLNSGTIRSTAAGDATGVRAIAAGMAFENRSNILVNGDSLAVGVDTLSYGPASLLNSAGQISAISSAGDAYGVQAVSHAGLSINNAAAINASAYNFAAGIVANTYADALIVNRGSVAATSSNASAAGIGVNASAAAGNTAIQNSGTLSASAYDVAGGIAVQSAGNATILNTGSVTATSTDGAAAGIAAGADGTLAIENRNTVSANGYAAAVGVVLANGAGAASLLNSGTISSTAAYNEAIGVQAGGDGSLIVDNRGLITAVNDDSAVAVSFDTAGTLVNSGTLRPVSSVEGSIAVRGDTGVQDIRNSGRIYGALVTGAGDDRFANAAGGLWTVTGDVSNFGSGDDLVTNAAGGTILLQDGGFHFGSSTNLDRFNNAGTLRVNGQGLVDMGTGPAALVASSGLFTNTGLIDMADGRPDDVLKVIGDLSGNGHLAIDADLDGAGADRLVIQGNMAAGAVQTVDMRITGVPRYEFVPTEFARVTGNSTANSFVAGTVTGFSPADFLDLRVAVHSDISASNATPDIFYVGLDVVGLSASGVVAASVPAGAHSLMSSEMGSWRERMGIDPSLDGGRVGLGPWVRFFGNNGRVAPTNQGGNMGSVGDLRFDQSNHGHEVGFDANIGGGFHAGVMMGKVDGTQRLVDGSGTDRLHGGTSGVYGTWFGANGSYVDLSYRWMNFDARLNGAGFMQNTRGDGHAVNVEAGLGGLAFGRVNVVPQVQYTRSTIDNIDAIVGKTAVFEQDGGTSSRGRLGVEFNTLLRTGDISWTPYGALSAVREFDGESAYSIGTFTGTTNAGGTSAKVDLGLGMQYRGFSVTGGASWTDGGSLKDFVGGQAVLRYTW